MTLVLPSPRIARLLCLVLTLLAPGTPVRAQEEPATARILVLRIDGPIGPATEGYILAGLDRAAATPASLVLIEMDTPGGLDGAMRAIVKAILASPVPVAGYVTPSGARAASAGTYILYAAHVAAMAPGTNLGAATPVTIGGGEDEDASSGVGMRQKIVNDAVAYIRGLAELRERSADWAEQAVREAASLSATDALRLDVIDLLAADRAALLAALDGRTVEVAGREATLRTMPAAVEVVEPTWRTRLLATITNPTVAYILLLLGIYGIVFELYAPGLVGPGLFGAIALFLALYAFQLLPVDHAGLVLLLFGLALIVAEAFVPSFGALGIAGIVAFVTGSIMLLDTDVPGFALPWELVASVAGFTAMTLLVAALAVARSRRRAPVSGASGLLRARGEVVTWQGTRGTVRVEGELWEAHGPGGLRPGEAVQVRARHGLVLEVGRELEETRP